jgi:hypothetical protein
MFFDCERARIELHTEEFHVRNVASPGFSKWESYKKWYDLPTKCRLRTGAEVGKRWWNTNRTDIHGRASEVEKLVDAGDKDGPYDSKNPSAQSGCRHRGIIRVCHSRSNFGIRRLVF